MSNTTFPQSISDEQLPGIDVEPAYLPFRKAVFSEFTKKQIRILLATREVALRGNGTQKQIASLAESSASYVTLALSRGINRYDLPIVYTFATECIGDKEYEDLTPLQQQVINYRVVQPDISFSEIADRLDCSFYTAYYTCRKYSDIVDAQSSSTRSPVTGSDANDIPIDDLLATYRNETTTPTDHNIDPSSPLLEPFTDGLLEKLPPVYRFVLLAAREWALHGDAQYKPVATVADTPRKKARYLIEGFRHYEDIYPTAARIAEEFAPDHSYELLTPTQAQIVDAFAINPTMSNQKAANIVDVDVSYARRTRRQCRGIIHRRRQTVGAEIVTPAKAFRFTR